VRHLRTFGEFEIVKVAKKLKRKLEDQDREMILVGYSDDHNKGCLSNNKQKDKEGNKFKRHKPDEQDLWKIQNLPKERMIMVTEEDKDEWELE